MLIRRKIKSQKRGNMQQSQCHVEAAALMCRDALPVAAGIVSP
jgi:hypothetical protein